MTDEVGLLRRPFDSKPECVDRAGQPAQKRQDEIDPKMGAEAHDQKRSQRRKNKSQNNQQDSPHVGSPLPAGLIFRWPLLTMQRCRAASELRGH